MIVFKKFSTDGQHDLPEDLLVPLVSLLERSGTQCRWPYPDLQCCGRETDTPTSPYCAVHHVRSTGKLHQPIGEAEERRRAAHERRVSLPKVLALAVLDLL